MDKTQESKVKMARAVSGILETLADSFNLLLPQKRNKVNVSSVSTQNLAEAIDKIEELFDTKMDKIVEGIRFTYPDFYKAYQNARDIIDPPHRKAKVAGTK
jgi:hypothetical protein